MTVLTGCQGIAVVIDTKEPAGGQTVMNQFALCRESDQGAELCKLHVVRHGELLPPLDAGAGERRERG